MLGGKGCRTHMDKHVSQNVSKYRHVSRVAVSHIHQYSLLNHPRLFGCCILIILIHAQDGASPACVLHMPLQFSFYFFGIFHVSLDLRKVASNNPIKHGLRQPVLLNHNRQPSNQYIKCFQNLAALLQRYCSAIAAKEPGRSCEKNSHHDVRFLFLLCPSWGPWHRQFWRSQLGPGA